MSGSDGIVDFASSTDSILLITYIRSFLVEVPTDDWKQFQTFRSLQGGINFLAGNQVIVRVPYSVRWKETWL